LFWIVFGFHTVICQPVTRAEELAPHFKKDFDENYSGLRGSFRVLFGFLSPRK
jgi:hypothetical protein